MSGWLSVPSPSEVVCKFFVIDGAVARVLSVVVNDNGVLYFVPSSLLIGIMREMILSSPFISERVKPVAFKIGVNNEHIINSDGWKLNVKDEEEFTLFLEEIRSLISSYINRHVQLWRKGKPEEGRKPEEVGEIVQKAEIIEKEITENQEKTDETGNSVDSSSS
ncbi:MAG: hypothetical protein ACP5IZ_10795 [Thermoprotei archaeon]